MVTRIGIVALLLCSVQMYGMGRAEAEMRRVESYIEADRSAFSHSTVAHDYSGIIKDKYNKHYLRFQKMQFIKMVLENKKTGNGTVFSQHLAKHFSDEDTRLWIKWVEKRDEVLKEELQQAQQKYQTDTDMDVSEDVPQSHPRLSWCVVHSS